MHEHGPGVLPLQGSRVRCHKFCKSAVFLVSLIHENGNHSTEREKQVVGQIVHFLGHLELS